jgi:hypothetical protein
MDQKVLSTEITKLFLGGLKGLYLIHHKAKEEG